MPAGIRGSVSSSGGSRSRQSIAASASSAQPSMQLAKTSQPSSTAAAQTATTSAPTSITGVVAPSAWAQWPQRPRANGQPITGRSDSVARRLAQCGQATPEPVSTAARRAKPASKPPTKGAAISGISQSWVIGSDISTNTTIPHGSRGVSRNHSPCRNLRGFGPGRSVDRIGSDAFVAGNAARRPNVGVERDVQDLELIVATGRVQELVVGLAATIRGEDRR